MNAKRVYTYFPVCVTLENKIQYNFIIHEFREQRTFLKEHFLVIVQKIDCLILLNKPILLQRCVEYLASGALITP